MSTVIELNGAGYSYCSNSPFPQTALRQVSLSVQAGELIALIGATGSGKSTLMQLIAGLLLPAEGEVQVMELKLHQRRLKAADLDRHRRKVVMALQRPEDMLFKTYVGDDVAYGPANYGQKDMELARAVKRAMDSAGLPYSLFKDRRTDSLSGGEKRKAALAGVLALDPEILLLDEPAAGLDPEATEELFSLIGTYNRKGKTVLYSTHDMNHASLADRVVLFRQGAVLAVEPPAELFLKEDLLLEAGLLPPDILRLASEFRKAGVEIGTPPLSADIESLAKLILHALARKGAA